MWIGRMLHMPAGYYICLQDVTYGLQDAMSLAPCCTIVMPLAFVDVFNPEVHSHSGSCQSC